MFDLVLSDSPLPAPHSALPTPHSEINSSPNTLSSSPVETIGVTGNHPFWSLDRLEFVQVGELAIGERLQTLAGDTKWVQQKLPRPGPEPVYNLEIHGEHVYYVGDSGVLAHNAGSKYNTHVYVIHDAAGNVKYVGISKHPHLRELQHILSGKLKRGEKMTVITPKALNRAQARTLEAKLIYGFLENAKTAGARGITSPYIAKQLKAAGLRNKIRALDRDSWTNDNVKNFISTDPLIQRMLKGVLK